MYILGIWGYSNVRDLKFITADTIARLKKKKRKKPCSFTMADIVFSRVHTLGIIALIDVIIAFVTKKKHLLVLTD